MSAEHDDPYQPSDGFDDGCCDCLDNDPEPCGHHAWLYNEGITG